MGKRWSIFCPGGTQCWKVSTSSAPYYFFWPKITKKDSFFVKFYHNYLFCRWLTKGSMLHNFDFRFFTETCYSGWKLNVQPFFMMGAWPETWLFLGQREVNPRNYLQFDWQTEVSYKTDIFLGKYVTFVYWDVTYFLLSDKKICV